MLLFWDITIRKSVLEIIDFIGIIDNKLELGKGKDVILTIEAQKDTYEYLYTVKNRDEYIFESSADTEEIEMYIESVFMEDVFKCCSKDMIALESEITNKEIKIFCQCSVCKKEKELIFPHGVNLNI